MEDILKRFGERVRDLRKAQGLSQEELAEKANLHYTYVGGVERGERNLSLKSIEKIAAALEIGIRELFPAYTPVDEESMAIVKEINSFLTSKESDILRLIELLVRDIDLWTKEKKPLGAEGTEGTITTEGRSNLP